MAEIEVNVRYFASLRDERGIQFESLRTVPQSAQALYESLRVLHGFSLAPELIRFAVNGALVPPETDLANGNEIAFLPPVAGG